MGRPFNDIAVLLFATITIPSCDIPTFKDNHLLVSDLQVPMRPSLAK